MDPKAILLKLIDEEGLKSLILEDLLDGVIKAKLDELVADSENSLDDALLAMIFPVLREELNKFISEKLAELQA